MSTIQRKAQLDLMERQALMTECRRQQHILETKGNSLAPAAVTILQQSLRQKLARIEALRTGKPVATTVAMERQRAV